MSRALIFFSALLISMQTRAVPATETTCNVRALYEREGLSTAEPSAPAANRTDAQLRQIFSDTRADLIEEISGGKPASELNQYQKLMIKRLQTMDQLVIKQCPRYRRSAPGASNKLLTNRIEICSDAKAAPEIALRALFGHEFGHSLDIVNLGCRTFRIKQAGARLESRYPAVAEAPVVKGSRSQSRNVSGPGADALDVNQFRSDLILISEAQRTFNECAFRGPERVELERMITRGQIEMVDGGVPVMRHPQRAAYQCLADNYSSSWRAPPATQAEAQAGGYQGYGEDSAQIWGARAAARFVRSNPRLTSKEVLGLTYFVQLNDLAVKGRDDKEEQLDEVYFSEPAIQNALRCRPDEKQNCMSHFRPSQSGAGASSSRPASGSR